MRKLQWILLSVLICTVTRGQEFSVKTEKDFAYSSRSIAEPDPFFGMPNTNALPANSVWIGEYKLFFRVWASTWQKYALQTLYYSIAYNFSSSGCQTSFTFPSGSTMTANFVYFNVRMQVDTLIYFYYYPPGYDAYYHLIVLKDSLTTQVAHATYTGTGGVARTSEFYRHYNVPMDTMKAQLTIFFRIAIGSNAGHLKLQWAAMPFVVADYAGGSLLRWTSLKKGSSLWMKRIS
jgi:hypothetical protein